MFVDPPLHLLEPVEHRPVDCRAREREVRQDVRIRRPTDTTVELGADDQVVLETRDRWFTWTLTGSEMAAPTERLLTMTTCEPEYSAAERLTATPWRAEGLPSGL